MAKSKKLTKLNIENQLQDIDVWEKHIAEKTPKEHIKTRKGPGNMSIQYVETGYIIQRLNQLFNYMWDFEIIEEKIGKTQVSVRGRLTVHLSPEIKLTKTQYGGSDIKKFKNGVVISIANDLKAAASDSLKKCASLFGIASDIYWGGEVEDHPDIEDGAGVEEPTTKFIDTAEGGRLSRQYFALMSEIDIDGTKAKVIAKEKMGLDSYADITKPQLKGLIGAAKKRREALEPEVKKEDLEDIFDEPGY